MQYDDSITTMDQNPSSPMTWLLFFKWHWLAIITLVAHFAQSITVAVLNPTLVSGVNITRFAYVYRSRLDYDVKREIMFEYKPVNAIIIFFALSFIFQAIEMYYYWQRKYEQTVEIRYVEYALSASVMFATMGAVSGMVELSTVMLLGATMFGTNILGLCAHVLFDFNRWFGVFVHLSGWVTFGVPFGIMVEAIARTNSFLELDIRQIIAVYVVGAAMCVFGFVQVYDFVFRPKDSEDAALLPQKDDNKSTGETFRSRHFYWVGSFYDFLSLVAKTLLGWSILGLIIDQQI